MPISELREIIYPVLESVLMLEQQNPTSVALLEDSQIWLQLPVLPFWDW